MASSAGRYSRASGTITVCTSERNSSGPASGPTPGRGQGRLVGASAGDRVEADHPASAFAQLSEGVDMGPRVHALDLLDARRGRLEDLQAVPVDGVELALDCADSLGVLRMRT